MHIIHESHCQVSSSDVHSFMPVSCNSDDVASSYISSFPSTTLQISIHYLFNRPRLIIIFNDNIFLLLVCGSRALHSRTFLRSLLLGMRSFVHLSSPFFLLSPIVRQYIRYCEIWPLNILLVVSALIFTSLKASVS